MTGIDPIITALARLERPLRLTQAGLWAERLTRSFWPLWSIVLGTLAVLSFGAQDHVGVEVFWTAVLVVAGGLVWGVWYGVQRFRIPTRTEALVRLDSRLPGNPIAALRDTQAIGAGDPMACVSRSAAIGLPGRRCATRRPSERAIRRVRPYGPHTARGWQRAPLQPVRCSQT